MRFMIYVSKALSRVKLFIEIQLISKYPSKLLSSELLQINKSRYICGTHSHFSLVHAVFFFYRWAQKWIKGLAALWYHYPLIISAFRMQMQLPAFTRSCLLVDKSRLHSQVCCSAFKQCWPLCFLFFSFLSMPFVTGSITVALVLVHALLKITFFNAKGELSSQYEWKCN